MTIEGKSLSSLIPCEVFPADRRLRNLRFDSSVGRGDFKTKIGVGKVIRG